MPSKDNRSNRCKRCGGTYSSRKHQRQCRGNSRKRSSRTRTITRRTASEILASSSTWHGGIVVDSDFYTQESVQ